LPQDEDRTISTSVTILGAKAYARRDMAGPMTVPNPTALICKANKSTVVPLNRASEF